MSGASITVLMGGPDAERDISIHSGQAIAHALRESGSFLVEELLFFRLDRDSFLLFSLPLLDLLLGSTFKLPAFL